MEYNISKLAQEFLALGGSVYETEIFLPVIDTKYATEIQIKMAQNSIDYKRALESNPVRALIPSYKRKMKDMHNLKHKELTSQLEAHYDSFPKYRKARLIKDVLDAVSLVKGQGVNIGDNISEESLSNIFRSLGGKVVNINTRVRRGSLYSLPEIESDTITALNQQLSIKTSRYSGIDRTLVGKLPIIKDKVKNKREQDFILAEKQLEDEKMKNPDYRKANAVMSLIYAVRALDSEMAKNTSMGE